MKIFGNICEMIGETPLLSTQAFSNARGVSKPILAKLECFNPAGSVKDRVALSMLSDAEKSGKINSKTTIIEPTSGNTGIGLAAISAQKGYKVILTMPETMSVERRMLLSAYGAKIVLTDGKKGMNGAIEKAAELAREIENSFVPSQFSNLSNPAAHEATTAPEIWRDSDGKIDIFVATVGTGGTFSGCSRFFKTKNPNIRTVAVEPKNSPVLSGGSAAPHKIQGIGAGFVPQNFDRSLCDEILAVSDEDALEASRLFAKTEGILVGISSGAALAAAAIVAANNPSKTVVTILPDGGERYMSTTLFATSEK